MIVNTIEEDGIEAFINEYEIVASEVQSEFNQQQSVRGQPEAVDNPPEVAVGKNEETEGHLVTEIKEEQEYDG